MRGRLLVLMATAIALITVSGPLFAHHGTAAFDVSKMVTMKATITDFQFTNPHVQVFWDSKNEKGEVEKWQGELTAPNKLTRAGWTKHTLKPGDEVTISGNAESNGSHVMWIRKIIGTDGQPMQLFED